MDKLHVQVKRGIFQERKFIPMARKLLEDGRLSPELHDELLEATRCADPRGGQSTEGLLYLSQVVMVCVVSLLPKKPGPKPKTVAK